MSPRNRHIVLMGLTMLVLASCSRRPDGSKELLHELDNCISQREVYQQAREQRMDSLRRLVTDSASLAVRAEISGRLVEEYRGYNLDSQRIWARYRLHVAQQTSSRFEQQAALLNMAEVTMRSGMYHDALLSLDSVRILHGNMEAPLLPYYYHLRRTVYGLMADFSADENTAQDYARMTQAYRDSMLAVQPDGSFVYELVRADKLYAMHQYDSALQVLDDYAAQSVIAPSDTTAYAITMAQIYHALGRRDMEKYWLIHASLADIRHAVREYIALRDLAILLQTEGDISRAYSYMQCAVEDASAGSARVRLIENGMLFPVVEGAYQRQVQRQQRTMAALVISVLVIVVLLIAILIVISCQRRALAQLNDRLRETNADLTQSNQIKTLYVGRYMEMTSTLINSFDDWRRQLKTLGRDGNYDRVQAELDSKHFTVEQRAAFYHDFDEAFLNIFPDFVEKVQALLVDGTEFHFKQGERLNTDLRVLALIRLGISESKQIASFLHYSQPTIYNSRTHLRNLAKDDRDRFEEKIATL